MNTSNQKFFECKRFFDKKNSFILKKIPENGTNLQNIFSKELFQRGAIIYLQKKLQENKGKSKHIFKILILIG